MRRGIRSGDWSCRRAAAVGATGVALVVSCASVAVAQDESRRVEVRDDQTTTVVGRFESLSALLGELCTRADVELRGFDAPDRALEIAQVARPLTEVIARVLSRENYLLGVRAGASPEDAPTITWIRVTGTKEDLGGGLAVPSRFGGRAFEDESERETRRARQVVADRLLADERRVALFLRTDAAALARSLRQYPHIEDLLRALRARQSPAVAAKLDAVIEALQAADPRGAD